MGEQDLEIFVSTWWTVTCTVFKNIDAGRMFIATFNYESEDNHRAVTRHMDDVATLTVQSHHITEIDSDEGAEQFEGSPRVSMHTISLRHNQRYTQKECSCKLHHRL